MQIHEALDRHQRQLQANGRSLHTRRQVARHIRHLMRWLEATGHSLELTAIDHETIAAYIASDAVALTATGARRRATSGNTVRSSLRVFFGFVADAGYASTNAARLLRHARCAPPPPRGLSDTETRMLLETVAVATEPTARRDHLLVDLLLSTGIRIGSAVGLDVEDVDLERRELLLRSAKGEVPLTIYLGEAIARHLESFIAERRTGPLFIDRCGGRLSLRHLQRLFAAWGKRAGIPRAIHPHEARHTFAKRVHARCGDILVTQRALGHKAIASTAIYASASEKRIRAAL